MTSAEGSLRKDSAARRVQSPFRRLVADYCESRLALIAVIVFAALAIVALLCRWIAPIDPYDLTQISVLDGMLPPGSASLTGMTYLLGTDIQGRDLLSAILYGLRTSLIVAVLSGTGALLIGTSLGLVSAYVGGRLDSLIMRGVDIMLSFPAILIALLLLAVLGQGVSKIIVALIAAQWATYARIVRASGLVERNREYIEAAHCLALGRFSILFRHLLPNCLPVLIVYATLQVANAISLEATLSFLGLGLPPTEPSLGLLIANGFEYVMSGHYWVSFYPGLALMIAIVSINLIGDKLRDVLNPRLSQ